MSRDFQEAAKSQLAVETLRATGTLRLRVTGSSMLPAVRPGDVLTIRQCEPGEVPAGSVVLISCYGRLAVHRLIARTTTGFVTQGDAVPQPDPMVGPSDLLGTVVEIVRGDERITPAPHTSLSERVVSALVRRSMVASKALQRAYALHGRAQRLLLNPEQA